ncbi:MULTISPECIES: M3 family oligoendopeptidase [unclassified Peribacillus]|uniref:M3 family oligoendopeptidase n=1 Tax=unclassified Peribacillus TaxID=2675266 RepID=UPI0019135486|nr:MULTISPECIES: M3 family oligoendopeptidase [unclassified Peribacillus]MBK5445693.1 M3 family oligoendopeptidase [Peribacillus sp. TH24]MBK5459591.1 M3 family oligoendopeptidase [Peribacillus sp. TH27]MBK5497780.1 M3 family oligoendopeptidase [Peribacillus sp. TH14]
MKFNEYEYRRPEMDEIKSKFTKVLEKFRDAQEIDIQVKAMEEINEIRNYVGTMLNLVYIRHSIDTNDEFYKAENDYLDEFSPEMEELTSIFYTELVRSKFRRELEMKWGKQLFDLAEAQLKTFSPEIIPHLQKENKLSSEYSQLIASAKIEFEGEERTLAQLQPFMESADRELRKNASEAYYSFFEKQQAELDRIFDELVKVRHEIATMLGYKNFVELGYNRMTRTDYNAEMAAAFRKQVKEDVVPLVTRLKERQRERLGLENLCYFDENFQFRTGNAIPKGDAEWIIENGKTMYRELSTETNEFFNFMIDNNLMDLVAKKGKESGGYCTFIEDYKAPFIFSNFNGTSGDIDVLTHEAGHAFQVYRSRNHDIPEYYWPTYEACEIHSMSMEFLTWPWMELFFKEDTEKYKFSHLSSSLVFLPYGVAVDEFQHFVYETPDASPLERRQAWRKIEKDYLPHRDYEGNEFLENGGYWQRQSHIYQSPFYYIDYALAQICAFQFWKRSVEGDVAAWEDYLNLCQLGGSKSFLGLVESANLKSPFADGTVQSVVKVIDEWLSSVDDQTL